MCAWDAVPVRVGMLLLSQLRKPVHKEGLGGNRKSHSASGQDDGVVTATRASSTATSGSQLRCGTTVTETRTESAERKSHNWDTHGRPPAHMTHPEGRLGSRRGPAEVTPAPRGPPCSEAPPPSSRPASRPVSPRVDPPTDAQTATKAQPQREGHTTHTRDTPGAPGSSDQGVYTTGPHRTSAT